MPDLAETIQQEVTTAVNNDELQLPALPEVALRIRDEAENQNVSAQSLGQVLSADPALSARMIKIANSPMFRAANTIENLNMALSRLGVVYAANLATGLAMSQMFQATNEIVDRKLRATGAEATNIAAISAVMAKSFTSLRPDQAALAGLTHTIGVLPILTWAEENETLLRDSLTLDRVIESIHGSLGTMILQRWDFPPEIIMVPAQYTNFERAVDEADYIDVVMVANLQNLPAGHPHTQLDWSTINAFENLGLEPDQEASELKDLEEGVRAARDSIN
jgi:HD-like signal output (HDOD) protein